MSPYESNGEGDKTNNPEGLWISLAVDEYMCIVSVNLKLGEINK